MYQNEVVGREVKCLNPRVGRGETDLCGGTRRAMWARGRALSSSCGGAPCGARASHRRRRRRHGYVAGGRRLHRAPYSLTAGASATRAERRAIGHELEKRTYNMIRQLHPPVRIVRPRRRKPMLSRVAHHVKWRRQPRNMHANTTSSQRRSGWLLASASRITDMSGSASRARTASSKLSSRWATLFA